MVAETSVPELLVARFGFIETHVRQMLHGMFRNTNPFNPPKSPMGNYIINPNVQIRKPSLLRKRSQDQQLSEAGLRFEPTFPWLQRLCFCP